MELWFEEREESSLRYGYKVEDILFRGKSDYQSVDIVETKAYGRVMLIDGLVMLTDRDEFVYHEMIAHIPMLLHPKPCRAVVIGGGDGGTVRELLRHSEIEKIDLCEIDSLVVSCAEKYFPSISQGLRDARVTVHITDGIEYVKSLESNSIDLLIVDSTDPIGPGEGLFTQEFYKDVKKALTEEGLMVCQSESPWQAEEGLARIWQNISSNFEFVRPYIGSVPTYPRGFWSWTLASNKPISRSNFDLRRLSSISSDLKYLNKDIAHAAFALPNFYRQKLGLDTLL